MSKKRRVLLTEFVIQVYSDKIVLNGFDKFLWHLLTRKPADGFLPCLRKIQRLGVCAENGGKVPK